MPSIHAIIAHAGLLPVDPTQSSLLDDSFHAEPSSEAMNVTLAKSPLHWKDPSLSRTEAELALASSIPQNIDPWTLTNMRSILRGGNVTKDSDQGTPWSELWNAEMASCTGPGARKLDDSIAEEAEGEQQDLSDEDEAVAKEDEKDDRRRKKHKENGGKINKPDPSSCSPINVIYVRLMLPEASVGCPLTA